MKDIISFAITSLAEVHQNMIKTLLLLINKVLTTLTVLQRSTRT